MNFKLVLIIMVAVSASTISCGSMRSSNCGLSKSLKILNIHDQKEPQIMLVNNTELNNKQES
ncbi:hypothetical protein [Flavicella sediminum]|uniref:hypothetical protein n=1 Tax=Flavicella sediminum TaxID=2585141 RepID=UPI0011242AF4|nr:hypothetical protein [Flavicella sediminum]